MDKVKEHWEGVYNTKTADQVSWTQVKPVHSLKLITDFNLPKDVKIIDIGGGDSNLVDHLIEAGYTDITVLDISKSALERAKKRLGDKAHQVTWIESNITDFHPSEKYAIWHDRAVFHFLTAQEAKQYSELVSSAVEGGIIMATFSKQGPLKCSGLEIIQYNAEDISNLFEGHFSLQDYFYSDHMTPFETTQNFVYCRFLKNK
ncbi:class I SAM-dependent methyltransferase [Myroides albus]|uniref:Methyltransferase domain-containing protein n=1 Tax=Myroides albus TaxID=2562892 RepID=A0A6I3LRG3_9FLAO|nr:class I SAM-dependent methyltransferase [Myroides albus]MTG99281.1 methyltransferase domain-containing protein [Myroides albus]UVD79835.1 class I SAM-dependent methyltransferase [Myroides albus]